MPQGIVDVLEAINVKKEHGYLVPVALRQGDCLIDPVIQKHSIGQTSEHVVLGSMRHLLRHFPRDTHIAKDLHRSDNPPTVIVNGSNGVLDVYFRSVTPDDDGVT